jgi:hypothetical protein
MQETIGGLFDGQALDATLGPAECYQAGCIAYLTYADQTVFVAVEDHIARMVFPDWSFIFTGPELQSDGRVSNALVLLRPVDEGELTDEHHR